MKYTDVTVPDKAISKSLLHFTIDALEADDADAALKLYALDHGAKQGDEAEAAISAVKDLMLFLVGAVDKQGPDKVLKTLEQMMKDE